MASMIVPVSELPPARSIARRGGKTASQQRAERGRPDGEEPYAGDCASEDLLA
jgi:hypothetical protein